MYLVSVYLVIDCGSLEFAHARLHSRHGQRADESTWQRLETVREFAALLETARGTSLQPWVFGLTATASARQIEAALRSQWRMTVVEVVGWMPARWQAALSWCAVLPDLPLLQHLACDGEVSAAMLDDPEHRALCDAPSGARLAVLSAGRLAALAMAWSAQQTSAGAQPSAWLFAWHAEWRRRLPRRTSETDDKLAWVEAALHAHASAFAAAPPGSGKLLRQSLGTHLSQLLRRAMLDPAAAFIHITLCGLDLERLRGELLLRALFTDVPSGRAA